MELYRQELTAILESRPEAFDVLRVRPPEQPGLDRFQKQWARWFTLPRLLASCETDIYHCIEPGDLFAARRLDLQRVVTTCHDLIPWRFQSWRTSAPPKNWISRALYEQMKTLLRRVARIISPSDCTRRDLLEYLEVPPERVTVIPYPVSALFSPLPSEREQALRQELRLRWSLPAGFLFLHVGSTVFYKNIENLLKAFRLFMERNSFPEAFLIRAGNGLTKTQADLSRRLGITSRILCVGPRTSEELADLYRAADTLVFPSLYEGFGRPALEAMASGTPVIAGRGGALPEVVEEAGLLVDPFDVEAIASAMQRLSADPFLRVDLRKRGLARAAHFRNLNIPAALAAVYQDVATQPRRGEPVL